MTVITNARVVFPDRIRTGGVVLDGGKISAVFEGDFRGASGSLELIDAGGLYLSPGWIDLHAHGAGGSDYMDGTPQAMEQAAKTQLRHGVTGVVPTALSGSREELRAVVDNFHLVKERMKDGPNLLGLHFEGPYFSPVQCGAQDPAFLRIPDPAEYEELVEKAAGAVKLWSSAPELPGALDLGRYLQKHGVVAAIGHSDAEYRQAEAAWENGYSHITHLYSAMSTIHRVDGYRRLGVAEAAYLLEGFTVELITDGCHLPPELIQLVYRLKGPDKICLITDSMRGAGMPEGKSLLGSLKNGQEVVIEHGVAWMPDHSSFAGSVATGDRLVRVVHQECGIPLWDAVRMASLTPARVLGLDAQKGSITAGKDADLLLFDDAIDIKKIFVMGCPIPMKEA